MPDKQIKAISPTSFSHFKAFEQCPKQFYHVRHKAEFPFVESTAMKYGNDAHKVAELYIRDGDEIQDKFLYMKPVLDSLNAKEGEKHCELKLGITRDFVPCSYWAKDIWIRGVIDLLITNGDHAWVIDYKTSKNANYADKDQLELMALLVFASYPEIQRVSGGLVFTKCNQLVKGQYKKINKAELWSKWVKRHNAMVDAHKLDVWPTRPSGLCRAHCPVTECIHNGANN